ncbi:MAG: ABC transporter permease [Candidatus Aminicenantes bacterium]|nr:ABC transporter permease [Candidatus Aminicenantes bacterium]
MFDLEQAVAEWLKEMRRKQALQDGDMTELEAHLRDKVEDLAGKGLGPEEAFQKAREEFDRAKDLDGDFYRARTTRRNGRPPWQAPRLAPALAWHYLKVMVRKARRQSLYLGINIGGLALGLAVCLLAVFWIANEAGFDRFHKEAANIAQVYPELLFADGKRQTWTGSFYPLAAELKAACPDVLDAARAETVDGLRIRVGDKIFTGDTALLADPSFFNIFTFPFVAGDPRTAFNEHFSAVVSETTAKKYFGDEDPMGKVLRVNDAFDLAITGVIRDVPSRSSLRFDIVAPFAVNFAPNFQEPDHWGGNPFQTYVLLRPGSNPVSAAETMTRIAAGHFDPAKMTVAFHLLPLTRKHLHDPDAPLAPIIRLFALVAAFILLLACVNFANLGTARGLTRGKEIGIRKAMGGSKLDLVKQFLGESLAHSAAALFLALGLALLLLPLFNEVMGASLHPSLLGNPLVWLALVGLTVFSGLAAGAYPAAVLARLEPRTALETKNIRGTRGAGIPQKVLIVLQFVLAGVFIVGTIILDRQMGFIKTADLGYDRRNLVSIPLNQALRKQYETLRTELLRHPAVVSVAASAQNPININSTVSAVDWEGRGEGRSVVMNFDWVGFDYFETLGIPLTRGRSFSRDFPADVTAGYIVNETAVRAMGLEDPVGRRLSVFRQEGRIVGVVRDFHFQPLRVPIKPFVFLLNPERNGECFIRIRPESGTEALAHIQSVFAALVPGETFDIAGSFLDDRMMAEAYPYEDRIRSGVRAGSLLAVLLSCAGLFGLAAFLTGRRTKEIGMRKILGASGFRLALDLSREFLGLVVLAELVALPAAAVLAGKLLTGYAFHATLDWTIFALAGCFSMVIAALTVGSLTLRAAGKNPVQSLRVE